jgi:hypothetical protein
MSGQLHAPAALPPGKEPTVPTGQEVGWAPEPILTTWRRENTTLYRDSNSDPSVAQLAASRYTDCAIPAPTVTIYRCQYYISHFYFRFFKSRHYFTVSDVLQAWTQACTRMQSEISMPAWVLPPNPHNSFSFRSINHEVFWIVIQTSGTTRWWGEPIVKLYPHTDTEDKIFMPCGRPKHSSPAFERPKNAGLAFTANSLGYVLLH